jgi:ATP-binding cassette subfamily C protein CydCD
VKPVDPRLLRYARTTRAFLLATVALGLAGAGLVIAQATLIADITVRSFQQHAGPPHLGTELLLLAAAATGRALVSWLTELAAHRTSAAVKSQLRTRLLAHASALGAGPAGAAPDSGRGQRSGDLANLATRGIDALDDYFARYLPQLGLAVAVPVAVLARVVAADWISAAVIVATLPLIPLFAALIGWATQAHTNRQWQLLARLSGHFLDVVEGLPTLKVFGRAKAQAASVRAITADYRRATLRALRIAFLSSFALELLATVSVALVAVGIGIRLVHGELDLRTGLVVLILAPEAYLPLRQAGAQYHAAAEGLAAADEVFTVLETPLPTAGTRPAPDLRTATLTLDGVCVRHPDRADDALPATSLSLAPGTTTALTGPSGAGKTTLLNAVLGLIRPTSGRVLIDGADLCTLDPAGWHAQIAWVPQHPHLFAGTIAQNVRLARPSATDDDVREALHAASADELDPATPLGESGAGISAGQRQRVALARAFLADRPLLLLDEPTAGLDVASEAAVARAVRRLAKDRTVLLTAHRTALLQAADQIIALGGPRRGVREDVREDVRAEALPAGGGARGGEESASPGPRGAAVDPERVGEPVREGAREPVREGAREGVREPAPEPVREGAREPAPEPVPALHPASEAGPSYGRVRPPRGRLVLAGVLGTLALLCATGLMATSGWLISRASQHPPILYLMVAVTATRTFGIGRAAFRYTERLVSHDAVLRALAGLRVNVFRRLERLAPAGLRDTRRGDLLTRLVSDVDAQQDHYLRWLLPAGTATVASLAAIAFTTALLPMAGAALALGLLVAGLAVPALTGALSRRTENQLAPARAALAVRALDLLTGTAELTVAGALPASRAAAREADAALTRVMRRSAAATALGSALTTLATGLTVTAAAWAGTRAVAAGQLHGVWLAVVVLTPLAAAEAVAGLPLAVQHRQRTRRSAERVRDVLEAPAPVREPDAVREQGAVPARGAEVGEEIAAPPGSAPPDPLAPDPLASDVPSPDPLASDPLAPGARSPGAPLPGVPSPGTLPPAVPPPRGPFPLALRGLTVRYPGAPTEGPAPLDGFDLHLTPGRRVAVVGPSGSGKTTLAHTLLRFLDPQHGTYTLGGTPAGALTSDAVRRHVGLCAQDAHIFDSTLRENLRLALPRTVDGKVRAGQGEENALWAALAAARLDGWAATLPRGLDTLVGEHGSRLSGGQRQRLALARALLADFPVLVLDEPAEHLDLPTADALTADLLDLSAGRSEAGRATVLITHRTHGLEAVDEIVVLDGGRAVERGTYAQLAAADGPFARMLAGEASTVQGHGHGHGHGHGQGPALAAAGVRDATGRAAASR